MTFILILFFVSLISIIFILYKRVLLIRENDMVIIDESPLLPDAKEVHILIVKHTKEFGFFIIEMTLRTYVRSSIVIKKKSLELYHKVKGRLVKDHDPEAIPEKKEVSVFLRTVSEYKKKINKLKNQIVEEETNS